MQPTPDERPIHRRVDPRPAVRRELGERVEVREEPSAEREGGRKFAPHVFQSPTVIGDRPLLGRPLDMVDRYILNWIRNPDPNGSFSKVSRWVSWVPDKALLGLMRGLKYDGLVFSEPGQIVAHSFYQRHGDALHMFSVAVSNGFEGRGCAEKALLAFLEHGRSVDGITKVRLGAGGHPATARICEKFAARAEELGVIPGENGWFAYADKMSG